MFQTPGREHINSVNNEDVVFNKFKTYPLI